MPYPYALPELVSARLVAQAIGIPVLYAPDLASLVENSQLAPAINLVPAGIAFVSQAATVSVRESIYVIACTRWVNQISGQGARQGAGPYLLAATNALLNHQFSGYSPLQFAAPPNAQYIAGFGYYPLQFDTIYEVK
jgi:hypothetical protein